MTTKRHIQLASALSLACLIWNLSGCSDSPRNGKEASNGSPAVAGKGNAQDSAHNAIHDPDDVPITEKDIEMPADYTALIARVEQLASDIRSKIEAGTPTKAHRSLDELDIVLKKAPEIASKCVPVEHWKTVNLQSRELGAAHDELHEKIDEKQNPDYPAVANRIQKALLELKAVPAQ